MPIVILLTVLQNEISSSKISVRNYNDTFDINIGAGYGVGVDQNSPLLSSLPKSTTKINHTTNSLFKVLSNEIQSNEQNRARKVSPRNIDNIKQNPNLGLYYQNSFETRNPKVLHPNSRKNSDDVYYQVRPNIKEIQTMINTLEGDDKYSKVVQVLKVPAVYEIHLQSNLKKKKQTTLPKKSNLHSAPMTNLNINYDAYVKWLNDYYSQRESKFQDNGNILENSLGNLLHFGKTDTSLSLDEINTVPLASQSHQQWSSKSFSKPVPAPHPPNGAFKNNKEITNIDEPPQAIFEVPAPYLGSPSKPRTHRTTKTISSNIKPPEPQVNQAPQRMNVYSTLTSTIPYDYRINRINKQMYNSGFIQSQRGINTHQISVPRNQNLVYGRPIEKVLSPQNIGISHRRTNQIPPKHFNDVLDPTKRVDALNSSNIYFTTENCNHRLIGQFSKALPPEDNIRKRKSKNVHDSTRRNLKKDSKVPDYYLVVTRIHEDGGSTHKR